MAGRTSRGLLNSGRSLSPWRTEDCSSSDGEGTEEASNRTPTIESNSQTIKMGGWGSASKMKEQGVEVARRNLRMHERNHSWGGLQSLGFDPLSEDVHESELSPSLASLGERTVSNLSPSSPPDMHDHMSAFGNAHDQIPPTPKCSDDTMYHSIMMISDFFYPDAGGVENHMFMLSQCLIHLGHKVIVCTRARGPRQGVRWLTGGLKVYYLAFMEMPDVFSSGRVTLPTLFSSFPILRNICIREGVTIVHGHQAFSILCHEGLMHAGTMGLKTIFTDHSLFGFSDPSAIHMNKVLNFTCSIINHVICVSHTSKENTVLRANIPPSDVSVIPNAVDTSVFTPNPAARKSNCITIVCLTRLVYRKGVDLMVEIIPAICRQFEHVNFVIGGDGPMRVALDQMRENHQLQDRVEMLGQVKHTDVRNVLVRGHIYLNCSLTEAFCIAILEAASCGLLVVSTKVGGVPEVMPSHMIKYAAPDPKQLTKVLARAIVKDLKDVVPQHFHESIRGMYSWCDVAMRTCKVYDKVARAEPKPLLLRLQRTLVRGPVFGLLISFLIAIDFLLWRFLCWLWPQQDMEIAVDYPNPHRARDTKPGKSGSMAKGAIVGRPKGAGGAQEQDEDEMGGALRASKPPPSKAPPSKAPPSPRPYPFPSQACANGGSLAASLLPATSMMPASSAWVTYRSSSDDEWSQEGGHRGERDGAALEHAEHVALEHAEHVAHTADSIAAQEEQWLREREVRSVTSIAARDLSRGVALRDMPLQPVPPPTERPTAAASHVTYTGASREADRVRDGDAAAAAATHQGPDTLRPRGLASPDESLTRLEESGELGRGEGGQARGGRRRRGSDEEWKLFLGPMANGKHL